MRRVFAVSVTSLALAAVVRAELPLPPDPVLDVLLQHALEHSPELAAARARAAAGAERPRAAGALPSPMLSVLYTNDGWSPTLGERDMTTLAVMASQELPDAGRRGLRARVREREAAQAAQAERRARLDVIAGVTRAYHDLRLARELLAVAREQEGLWQEIEASARARYAAGLAPQLEVLRAQVEVTRSRERLISRETEVAVRVMALNRHVARPLDEPVAGTPPLVLVPLAPASDELLRAAENESPELHAAAESVEGRRLEIDLARREGRPDFTVQAGYMNRGGMDPMWQAGLGVSWPFFSRGRVRAGIAAAREERRAVEGDVQAVRGDLRLRTRQRLARLAALEQVAALYEQGILPQGRLALEAAMSQYRAGRAPLVSVLEALTALVQDRATHVEQIAAHESLKARLLSFSLEPDDGAMPGAGGMGARPSAGMSAAAPMAATGGTGSTTSAGEGAMSGMGEGR